MSTVYLQVGQCGNQVGFQLWKLYQDELSVAANTAFNRYTRKARCVLVDSEPKVVEAPLTKNTHFLSESFNSSSVVYSASGRGNNWAMGFYEPPSSRLVPRTMDALRREVEACDYFRGTFMLHSVAGGTGSGLGSRLMQEFKDEYPVAFLFNASVFPSWSGETPLQDYNSCLTLSYLQEHSDGVFFFENDRLLNLLHSKQRPAVSTHNLNECIAAALFSCLYPQRERDLDYGALLQLAPSNSFKFLEAASVPLLVNNTLTQSREASWMQLTDSLLKSLPKREGKYDLTASCIRAQCYMRGVDVLNHVDRQYSTFYKKIASNLRPVPWAQSDYLQFTLVPERASLKQKIDRSVALVLNKGSVVTPLRNLLHSAKNKFEAGAYLHWYQKFGCEQEQFERAFERLQGVVDDYLAAGRSLRSREGGLDVAAFLNGSVRAEQAALALLQQ